MSLRTAVLIIFAATVVYAATFIPEIAHTADAAAAQLSTNPKLILTCALSAGLLLLGHVVRAWRDTILFSKAAKTTLWSQFAAFSTGSLCNAILPFKIGELMRADVLAQGYRISFSFSFVLICFERLVDAAILGGLALILLEFNATLAIMAATLLIFILLIWSPPPVVKKLIAHGAHLLNERLEAKTLFTFWSMEYGLKRTFEPKLLASYLAVSLVNWLVYLVALLPAIMAMSNTANVADLFATSTGAYVAMTASIAPGALGNFTDTLNNLQISAHLSMPILLWVIAIVPISVIGLFVAVFSLKHLPLLRARNTDGTDATDNKLSRDADISSDQIGFMKDYYAGNALAQKVARKEILGGPALLKYFTIGGSGALTFQSFSHDTRCVTKMAPQDESKALRAQYQWLVDHACNNIATALDEREDPATYAIDIEFEESSMDAMEYLHTHSLQEGRELFDTVIKTLDERVWRPGSAELRAPDDALDRIRRYIDVHVSGSLAIACDELEALRRMMECRELVICGEPYPNVSELLKRIEEPDILRDLADFRLSDSIHGDPICDNIIFSNKKGLPILIDPAISDNCFEGPVFDFGKLSQSLQIGYEFLLRDTDPVDVVFEGDVCIIWYEDMRSATYEHMWSYVYEEIAPHYLTASERHTMLFLGATNYFRRMKHQAVQCPQNALKFYAQGIRFLTEYVRLFDGRSFKEGSLTEEASKEG